MEISAAAIAGDAAERLTRAFVGPRYLLTAALAAAIAIEVAAAIAACAAGLFTSNEVVLLPLASFVVEQAGNDNAQIAATVSNRIVFIVWFSFRSIFTRRQVSEQGLFLSIRKFHGGYRRVW